MNDIETLAAEARIDVRVMELLWEKTERFIALQARRYIKIIGGMGGVTREDLYQSGYLALAEAVNSYDCERGRSFISWLAMHIKTAFAKTAGYHAVRQKSDPLHNAESIYASLDGENENTAEIADPYDAYEDAEHQIWLEQLRNVLEEALNCLPNEQSAVLRERYYGELTLREASVRHGKSPETIRQIENKAKRALQKSEYAERLYQFIEDNTNYYQSVSVNRFNTTRTSAVEMIAMRRERLAEKYCSADASKDSARGTRLILRNCP